MEEIKLEDLFVAAAEDNTATLLETLVKKLEKEDFGKGMQCLIIPSKMHFKEEEALGLYRI